MENRSIVKKDKRIPDEDGGLEEKEAKYFPCFLKNFEDDADAGEAREFGKHSGRGVITPIAGRKVSPCPLLFREKNAIFRKRERHV